MLTIRDILKIKQERREIVAAKFKAAEEERVRKEQREKEDFDRNVQQHFLDILPLIEKRIVEAAQNDATEYRFSYPDNVLYQSGGTNILEEAIVDRLVATFSGPERGFTALKHTDLKPNRCDDEGRVIERGHRIPVLLIQWPEPEIVQP